MSNKIWNLRKVDKKKALNISEELNIDPLAALILISRGFDTVDKCSEFMYSEEYFCDPFELKDMDLAVRRINQAIDNEEKICVYGDYDADGVTSTAVLTSYLSMIGADVFYYIPDRNTEGYGMNNSAISKICESGADLIITVDNGISAIEEAKYIRQLGMELVVTDHHGVGETIPDCVAVVDPHRKDCPSKFKDWCGVGIVFKLLCALNENDYEFVLDSYADLITLGTIGDVVSLTGENRSIVKRGLEKINSDDKNAGLAALIESASVRYPLNSSSVAFYICPKINAAGRVSHADEALNLLVSEESEQIDQQAQQIVSLNEKRRETEQEINDDIERMLKEDDSILYNRVLIFIGNNWHTGVIGIVAARMTEKYGKPCLVITTDGTTATGSARSIDGFSLFDCVTNCKDFLTHYGGHPLAAGFSLKHENLKAFSEAVEKYASKMDMPFAKLEIDCKLRPQAVSLDLIPAIASLEPFGQDNSEPVFGLFGMTVVGVGGLSNGKHTRMGLSKDGFSCTAVKFNCNLDSFPYMAGDQVDLAVNINKNEYNGQVSASIYIKEVRPSMINDELLFKSIRLYEKYRRGDVLNAKEKNYITPDREIIGDIFKKIKTQYIAYSDADILCLRMNDDGRHACTYMIAVDVLCELGLVVRNDNFLVISDVINKTNLDNSKILKLLREN